MRAKSRATSERVRKLQRRMCEEKVPRKLEKKLAEVWGHISFRSGHFQHNLGSFFAGMRRRAVPKCPTL